jgi:hypothetical protein
VGQKLAFTGSYPDMMLTAVRVVGDEQIATTHNKSNNQTNYATGA